MLFNSFEFIFVFLPISFSVYFYLNHKKKTSASRGWLVLTNLFFYGWWNIIYLPLILTSILFNYYVASGLINYEASKNKYFTKKSLLKIGLLFNVGLLFYFKYMDFFISNTNAILGSDFGLLHLALPLAISFFTLQQIAFLIDAYEGIVKKNNFLNYMLFVSFFPQLIAGPIVRYQEMMPQFFSVKNKIKNYNNIALGLFIFSVGLFKKVVIADTFALWATAGFDTAKTLNLFEAWATSLSYTFQLYFDFSGYADMAIGAALLFNIQLPVNFNSPYKATGMIDFWKRWHITLTNFITTYIYTPIIRSFKSLTFHKAMFATIIAFLISGLWHGSSWMFVIFGGLNGLGIVVNHYWKKRKIKINKYLAWFITFNFVNITFIFFRSNDLNDAMKVLGSMFSLDNIVLPGFSYSYLSYFNKYGVEFGGFLSNINADITIIAFMSLAFVITLKFKNINQYKLKKDLMHLITFVLISLVSILKLNEYSEFLYFQF